MDGISGTINSVHVLSLLNRVSALLLAVVSIPEEVCNGLMEVLSCFQDVII